MLDIHLSNLSVINCNSITNNIQKKYNEYITLCFYIYLDCVSLFTLKTSKTTNRCTVEIKTYRIGDDS